MKVSADLQSVQSVLKGLTVTPCFSTHCQTITGSGNPIPTSLGGILQSLVLFHSILSLPHLSLVQSKDPLYSQLQDSKTGKGFIDIKC